MSLGSRRESTISRERVERGSIRVSLVARSDLG